VFKAPVANVSHSDLQLYHGSFLRAPQCCSLGLAVRTQQERSRRSIIANETMQLNAEAGASLAKADTRTLNLKLWDAVEAGEVASANQAFLMGACADGFRECKMNPLVYALFKSLLWGAFFCRAFTALHLCSSRRHVNVCALLVASGANLEAMDNLCIPPIMHAFSICAHSKPREVVLICLIPMTSAGTPPRICYIYSL
jgi:hypothetical protein